MIFTLIMIWLAICFAAAGLPWLSFILLGVAVIDYRRRKRQESEATS